MNHPEPEDLAPSDRHVGCSQTVLRVAGGPHDAVRVVAVAETKHVTQHVPRQASRRGTALRLPEERAS